MVGLVVAIGLIVLAGGVAVSTALPASPSAVRPRPARSPGARPVAGVEDDPEAADAADAVSGREPDADALDIAELGGTEPPAAHHRVVSALRLVLTIAFLGAAAGATAFLLGRSVVLLIRLIAGVDDAA